MATDVRRDLEDFAREASDFRGLCRTMGNRTREVSKPIAGLLYVLEETVYREAQEVLIAWGAAVPAASAPVDEPAPRTKASGGKRAPKGQGQHRHKFDGAGKCSCGAERQRAPRGNAKPAERPSPEARTAALPLIGPGADRFDGGAFGSSGTGDR